MAMAPIERVGELLGLPRGLPEPALHTGFEVPAPVLVLPRVMEPELCRRLIAVHEAGGGEESGFMVERGGKTVGIYDPATKKRRNQEITEELLRAPLRACIILIPTRVDVDTSTPLGRRASARLGFAPSGAPHGSTTRRVGITRRIAPEMRKAFQFSPARIERDTVARYDGAEGGHVRAHRDNTTPGPAHRRFAVTINLNDEFDGGMLWFPEFGPRRYRPPLGGAVVFSCSLLHEATPVTRGVRFATLPFLYDDAAARIRQRNAHSLVPEEPTLDAEAAAWDAGVIPTRVDVDTSTPLVSLAHRPSPML
ncbi:MAG: 2OG-Fe(II) oxygenase, partial [Acetobacteraceae bacterium]|nr:2OG-Fe(II) oxygenase [Acetobacteraceae bacterium]